MPDAIIDGRGNWIAGGSKYVAGVTEDHKLMVDATVNATATSASDYKISGTHTNIGSASLIAGDYDGSVWPLRMFNGSYVMFAGSISSMPSVSATNESISKITTPHTGSGTLIGGNFNGSLYPLIMQGGSQALITGSVSISTSPLPVSGTNIGGSESVVTAGSIQTYNPVGTGSVYQIASQRTYPNFDIIRLSAGSPATNFVLAGISRSIMIENLGSNSVYFNFDATANPANSGTGFMFPRDVINMDVEVGSVSIQSSGTTNTEMQVIAIR